MQTEANLKFKGVQANKRTDFNQITTQETGKGAEGEPDNQGGPAQETSGDGTSFKAGQTQVQKDVACLSVVNRRANKPSLPESGDSRRSKVQQEEKGKQLQEPKGAKEADTFHHNLRKCEEVPNNRVKN